jgi:polynucleotide 5'-hydroxyl-kinase GRC3/NOL9
MDLSPLHALDLSAPGSLLMVIGAPDSGKSTLARQIYQELCRQYSCIAYLDGDPGQSLLGPPTTLSLAINRRGDLAFPPRGRIWRRFLGATSPRGHMLPMLVGIHRLVSTAREHGAQIVVYDTCGFVSAHEGGLALKLAEMELLRPSMVIALQRETELEPLLQVARASSIRTVRLAPSPRVQPRPPEQRRKYRAQRFQEYFREAQRWVLDKNSLAIVASFPLQPAQLVSLEDAQGFVLALGVLQAIQGEQLTLLTPLRNLDRCRILRAGSLLLDLSTFQESRIAHGTQTVNRQPRQGSEQDVREEGNAD